ncbi:PLP-dependent aminotransferase family protein [Bradyrhizobium sp. LHD-71]|uniref:aminotransferase-like domain-containing protein n=1 Tax=Bradyrhizobium sp. LHD-71 TaxID=3072141 RepID=UPI00280C9289|nr:PLP-dependent aminotransferase family protein [Bradyrhizobium sp. LHD-71]MDQ8729803.1 PLP-dependent aminotransferase family protein [Bradyrhizobium sp. LHD-71]
MDQENFRYEELARFIAALVDRGTLVPGTRAPSLRSISRDRKVSMATALQAYRLLEDRGVLQARPQSGFYVASRPPARKPPTTSRPPARATAVSVPAVVVKLLEHASDPNLVPLGCAIPDTNLLDAGRLDRLLARTARERGGVYNIYTGPQGDLRLRREIARRATRWGQALSPDDLVITVGCTEALVLALRAVTRPGDTVAIESPTYFGLLHALKALDLKALELPTDASEGIDLDPLQAALSQNRIAACLFASSFNNPLGCTMPDTKKLAVLDLLARHHVPLIEDDIYGDIYFGDERPRPFMALDRHGVTMYCSSFSKTVAPGYRIGWIAAGRHLPRVLDAKAALTLCGSVLPQAAFGEFLASGGYDSHLRRVRRVFAANIERMTRAIDRSFPAGTRVSCPAGGFVLWLELPQPVNTGVLFQAALDHGICFAPGEVFSASGRYANCLRISCGHSWDPWIERGVTRLGALAAEALMSNR